MTEIELYAKYYAEEEVETLYIGGGTPSILQPGEFERIFSAVRIHFILKDDAEITLEANPGTVSLQTLKEYRHFGANRISIGIQSFNDDELIFLSRIHSANDAHKTYNHAREAGFTNIGIDLIYAIPGQTINRWHATLDMGASLKPEHISAYNLTIEDATPLGMMVRSKIVSRLPDDDEALFFTHTMELLRSKGYIHYEVSNYAKPGYQSKHNTNYWSHANYLGFGPSAHSFWGGKRWWNVADTSSYITSLRDRILPVEGSELLSTTQFSDEIIMLGLRTGCLDLDRIPEAVCMKKDKELTTYLDELTIQGFIIREKNVIKLTDRGYLYCDEITKRISQLY